MGLKASHKILIVLICFATAIVGFMIKLPSAFRHIDKQLHAAFYFGAAAFLNVLFAQTKLLRHVFIFVALYLFGMAIEYAQEYSNKFLHRRVHGRYDLEDIQSNLIGLLIFSFVWMVCT